MTQAPSPYASPYASAPRPPGTNGLGLAGFIVSIVGMVVCLGALCPIGAVMSFAAVFKRPRGFAIAGLVIGGVGTVLWALLWWLFIASANNNFGFGNFNDLWWAQSDIDSEYYSHNRLPDDATGTGIVGWYDDQWGTAFEYRLVDAQNYEILSAGPDMVFGTADDVAHPFPAPTPWGGHTHGITGSTDDEIDAAREVIERAYGGDFESPAWHEVDRLMNDRFVDEWGWPLRYDAQDGDAYELRSSGPDGRMDTSDDIVRAFNLGEEPGEGDEGDTADDAVDDGALESP